MQEQEQVDLVHGLALKKRASFFRIFGILYLLRGSGSEKPRLHLLLAHSG
jgi:hypothetical protein